jgi:ATP/maltotriose-dependent transcriptional regulator MalT
MLERSAMLLVRQGRMSELLALVDKLPPAEVDGRPLLQIAIVWARSLLHDPHVPAVVLALPAPADPGLAAELDLIRAINAAFKDDVDGVDVLLARARRHLAPEPWLLGVAADVEAFVDLMRKPVHRRARGRARRPAVPGSGAGRAERRVRPLLRGGGARAYR